MNMLEAEKLVFSASGRNIIEDLSLQVPAGDVLAIIGPNGAGKSTLLKMLTGQLTPSAGAVRLQGEAVNSLAPSAMAKVLAYVPQGPQAPPDILVRELVSYGRHPHRAWYMGSRAEDEEAVERALERTGLLDLAKRPVGLLSGGERQRAWLALALAQQPQVLLLDEPTTFLDVCHQFELLDLLQRLNEEDNLTVVLVLHEINHALRYAKRVAVVKDGRLAALGPPWDVVTPELLRQVFRVQGEVVADSDGRAALLMQGLDRKSEQESR
ncbi:ABC transporter ATP-binding protein [Anaeroarcus burkinensis]|uniref:ABC transporter ATP-binding protein n=1 Tax=Anaeroarcus burkinensis TaxID=82376 RepID=UPI0004091210|nr:ABC transporter ATP-binding protein [Anaeroarcus burkinensis]